MGCSELCKLGACKGRRIPILHYTLQRHLYVKSIPNKKKARFRTRLHPSESPAEPSTGTSRASAGTGKPAPPGEEGGDPTVPSERMMLATRLKTSPSVAVWLRRKAHERPLPQFPHVQNQDTAQCRGRACDYGKPSKRKVLL